MSLLWGIPKTETEWEETVHEAEMRGLATFGIGPMLDIARSAVADFNVAFGCRPKGSHADGNPASKK